MITTPASLIAAWERGLGQPPLARSVTLLAAATDRSVEHSAAVDVGTRDAVLARVLARTAGTPVWTVLACSACGEQLDVPVDVDAVAAMPVHEPGATFEASLDGTTTPFRLPTSDDLAAVGGTDPASARRMLLTRCVATADELSDAAADAVETAMESAAPAAVAEVAVRCALCDVRTVAALDVATLLWAVVEAGAAELLRDVHVLARAYGWTEDEVLALGPRRRAAYLELAGA